MCILQETDCFNLKNRKHRNKNQASQIIPHMNLLENGRCYFPPPAKKSHICTCIRYDNASNQDNNEAKPLTSFYLIRAVCYYLLLI